MEHKSSSAIKNETAKDEKSIMEKYRELDEKCAEVLEKIKKRNNSK